MRTERAALEDKEDGRSEAVYYVQAIFALLADIVPGNEFKEIRSEFPEDEDYNQLFEFVGWRRHLGKGEIGVIDERYAKAR